MECLQTSDLIGEARAANKNRKLGLITGILCLGFLFSVVFHYVCGYYLKLGYPYNTFLFNPSDHFYDFYHVYKITMDFNAGRFPYVAYFPFTHIIISLLTLLPKGAALLLTIAVFGLTLVLQLFRFAVNQIGNRLQKVQTLAILGFMSYPVLFSIDRANIEVLIYVLLSCFLYFYYVRRLRWASILFLSAAIAMKYYPAVLLILFLSDRKYKEALYAALCAIGLTVAGYGFMMVETHRGLLQVIKSSASGVKGFVNVYSIGMGGLTHSHSLWSLAGVAKLTLNKPASLEPLLPVYTLVATAIIVAIAFYVIKVEQHAWRKVALLVVAMVVLPYTSGDYTLIHLYLPMVLFLNADQTSESDTFYSWLFGLMLIPMSYYFFKPAPHLLYVGNDVAISVLVYPIVMTVFMFKIMSEGLRQRQIDNILQASSLNEKAKAVQKNPTVDQTL